MKATFALASTLAGFAAAQGVTDKVSPTAPAPAGCTGTYNGQFEISVVQVSKAAKRDTMPMMKRGQCGGDGILVLTLKDGVTLDAQQRTGYIASNFQYQFDAPAQAGAIFTSGFSVCSNGSLALGGSNVFYECKSGSFYNLYDRHWAEQCEPVEIVALPCGGKTPVSQVADGQVVGTTIAQTTIVTALSDGQPQVITTQVPIPVCQINDGQVQGHTTPCASITIVPTPTSSPIPVSQSSDGQIQVTPPAPAPPASSAPPAAPPATTPVASPSASAPAPSASAPGTSAAPSSSRGSTLITSAPGTSAAPSTSAPAASATSSIPASGSSRVAGSIGALVVGLMVAFVCL